LRESPFAAAIEAVRRPLLFAATSQQGGHRIRDLERTVAQAAERARQLRIPRDAQALLTRVEKLFAETADEEHRAEAVRLALEWTAPLAEPGWAEAALERPLSSLAGVGPRRAEQLARRGLSSMGDLVFLLPTRYDDRRSLRRVGELEVGARATFIARVLLCDQVPIRGGRRFGRGPRRALQAVVGDDSGTVNLKWFRGADAIERQLEKGARLLVTGDVRRYRFAKELVHPEVQRLPEEGEPGPPPRVVPLYPATEGVPPRTLRGLVEQAVDQHADLVAGFLPARLAGERSLPGAAAAVLHLHRPSEDCDPAELLDPARSPALQRLVLEELFLLETGLAVRRAARGREPGVPIDVKLRRIEQAPGALPFELTAAQQRAWGEIRRDLGQPHPMQRLLQGDVGSGKTAVAFLAALAAAAAGHQAALMAPTELLAEQHARTLRSLAGAGGALTALRMALLTASVPRADAERVRADLAEGNLDLVIGTHALVQREVRVPRLVLAIVDEQHRFGVRQRAALAGKGEGGRVPHTLVMTATPIPRTLALTVYGDLDLSVIDELPPGRRPVATHVLRAGEGERVMELVRMTLERGEQVYVVYPLVEESEKIDLRAATEQATRIRASFPDHPVDLLHGRLDAADRAGAMERFGRGETRILVSTTVIEVGVDIPAATLMVVEHAERFGLAQLHQLRGRVGRGERPGTCLLVARGSGADSEARLAAMLETTDGFRIADADLRIRGPGEFLGTRQSGHLPDLRIADLLRDSRLVAVAREAALAHVRRDPGLKRSESLARAVRSRWGERLALVDVL
jgi:ATP-dependent DNA helicase RecG